MLSGPAILPANGRCSRGLDEIFSRAKRKLFFSCFSSSIYRIRIALNWPHANSRKVAIVGRSMVESSEIAQDIGYSTFRRDCSSIRARSRTMPRTR